MKRALAAVGDTGAAPGSFTKASFQKRKEMREGLEGFFSFFYLIFHTTRMKACWGVTEWESSGSTWRERGTKRKRSAYCQNWRIGTLESGERESSSNNSGNVEGLKGYRGVVLLIVCISLDKTELWSTITPTAMVQYEFFSQHSMARSTFFFCLMKTEDVFYHCCSFSSSHSQHFLIAVSQLKPPSVSVVEGFFSLLLSDRTKITFFLIMFWRWQPLIKATRKYKNHLKWWQIFLLTFL